MKQKRTFFICFIVLLLCALAGCAENTENLDAGKEQLREKVTILSYTEMRNDFLRQIIEKADFDFDVEITEVPLGQYEDKAHMMLMSQEATDILLLDAPNISGFASTGRLEPLDAYWDPDDFDDLLETSQQAMQWDNHIWAAPLNEGIWMLYYNKAALEEAQITPCTDPANPWTMEELLEAAQKLTKVDEEGNVLQYGLQPSQRSPENKDEGMTCAQLMFLWWFGGDVMSPDCTTASGYMDGPESIEALEYYGDLFNKYAVAPLTDQRNGFEEGRIAMWIIGPWIHGILRDTAPEFFDGGWGVMPLPAGVQAAVPMGSWNMAITKQSEHKEEAWQVIHALTCHEGMETWCDMTGHVPARKSNMEEFHQDFVPHINEIIRYEMEHTGRNRPMTPAYREISVSINNCFSSVAFGVPAKTAAETATREINFALKKNERVQQKNTQ